MLNLIKYSVLFGSLLLLWSCGKEVENIEEEPLATVFEKSLYPSDIKGIVGQGVSSKDSSALVRSFIENWAKEQLIIAIAEQNIPEDLDVDRLVQDYRLSLIRHSYEQKLVEQRLDSVVTDTEIKRYYESALEQYQLDKTIVQGKFVKLSKEAPKQDTLKTWWNNFAVNKQDLSDYCRMYADKFVLEDSIWIDVDYLAAEFPISSLKNGSITGGLNVVASDEEYNYYIKIDKVVRQGQIAPLSYVKNKIIKVILRKRKFELLDNMTDELYKRELEKKNVVISN